MIMGVSLGDSRRVFFSQRVAVVRGGLCTKMVEILYSSGKLLVNSTLMTNRYDQFILHAIKARLELDAGLGVEYLALPDGFPDVTVRQASAAAPQCARRDSVAATPRRHIGDASRDDAAAGGGGYRVAPAGQPPPASYVSLVPFAEPPANPEKEAALAGLKAECLSCAACALCEKRNLAAWGEGSLDASVMFIGEGPGRDEDREGRPFVGRSGRLLTDIIEKGMAVPRSSVYIANVVKCRPPGNRDPRPEEIVACSRFLDNQIRVIAPKVIVAVGGVSGCALLGLPPRTGGLRGKWHEYRGVPMRVIFHPSYLLRQRRSENDRTAADRDTWNDIRQIMAKVAELNA